MTFAAKDASLTGLLAPGLSLDTFGGHGFLAVACVKARRLRPRGLPERLGMDFFLVGYRLFVRFESVSSRRFRGLQILGSETDRWMMALGGRVFTHYRYRKVTVSVARDASGLRVGTSSGLELLTHSEPVLPATSVFTNWDVARRFAGPMPFTFASTRGGRSVVRVEGTRAHWEPRPVAVTVARVPFLAALAPDVRVSAAFLVENVDYAWKRGVVEAVP